MSRPRPPRLRWTAVAAVVVTFLCIFGTCCFIEISKIVHLRAAVAENSAKLTEKENNVRRYREMVEFYGTREGIAHLARERNNLVFPGERVFLIAGISSGDS
ncbi:MAG: septum formation initiator [Synergistaceae bacterium]|jgi:cell division protein FtsB|nr:septum formation initiator [Synergistaceae bacterium]